MTTLDRIIALEWNMFQRVQNEGGRASCQDDYPTFRLMRESQFSVWPEPVLASYLKDLETAEAAGRNLVTEKYARMMERTAPERFEEIRHFLPALGPEETRLIESIMDIQREWIREAAEQYPHILGRGRPISSDGDNRVSPSSETYFRCEISTYSLETLRQLYDFLADRKRKGVNITKKILEHTVKGYGFSNLEEAEARCAGT